MGTVCLAINRLANRSGGAERVVVTLANELCATGFDVTILTWEADERRPFYPLDTRVRIVNLMLREARQSQKKGASKPGKPLLRHIGKKLLKNRLLSLPVWKLEHGLLKNRLLSYPVWKLEHGDQIARMHTYFRSAKPDAVIAFLPYSFPYVVKAAEDTPVTVITSCHNVPERDFEDPSRWSGNPYDIWWRKECLRHSDAVTCLLEKFVPWFEQAGVGNLHVIPNFVDLPAEETLPLDRDSKTIVAVGRLIRAKDHRTLLQAWAQLKQEFPDWKVQIYGEGSLCQELDTLHAQLELGDSLVLRGVTRDIGEIYRNAEIFCIPSIHEGFGLVTAEAMSFGLPVVGFDDCDGTNDIITDGVDGLLASGKGDRPSNLADALRRLILDEDERRRFGKAALKTAKRFDKSESMRGWLAALSSVGIEAPKLPAKPDD